MRAAITRIATFALQPVRYLSYRIYALQSGYKTLKRGDTEFWGDKSFLEKAAAALDLLAEKDPTTLDLLNGRRPFIFVQYPEKLEVYLTSRLSTIDDSFIQWGAAGIAACLFYAVQVAQGGDRRWSNLGNENRVNKLFEVARSQTAEWLERNAFPLELVASFREGSR
jgi:hypothetical protein